MRNTLWRVILIVSTEGQSNRDFRVLNGALFCQMYKPLALVLTVIVWWCWDFNLQASDQ